MYPKSTNDNTKTRRYSSLEDKFNRNFPSAYQLMMMAIDDDVTKLEYVKKMNLQEFLYFISYKIQKQKLENQISKQK